MAGYSGTPLAKKLGIKPGHRVCVVGSEAGFDELLAPLPEAVTVQWSARGKAPFDVILLFVDSQRALETRFDVLRQRMNPAAGLWVCWPKKSSGVATDLVEDIIRSHGLASGLVDNKICAVDETWSGLRFVIRLRDR